MNNSASIFIADDNEINRFLLQSQLEENYNNLTFAADGKIALNYLQQNKYDLILLDIHMPFYSGLELIKIIKEDGSINQSTPVIAITAQLHNDEQKTLIDDKFDVCLIKPILLEQLDQLFALWLPKVVIAPPTTTLTETDYVTSLLQRSSGNIALATTIFNKLFIELPEQSLLIEQALKTNNLSLAKDITHKLHGSVSFCGFSDIQVVANDLESSFFKHEKHLIITKFDLLKKKITYFMLQKESIYIQLKSL